MAPPRQGPAREGLSLERFARAKRHDVAVHIEKQENERRRRTRVMRDYHAALRQAGMLKPGEKADGSRADRQSDLKRFRNRKKFKSSTKDTKGDEVGEKGPPKAPLNGLEKARQAALDKTKREEERKLSEEDRLKEQLRKKKERRRWKDKLGKKNHRGQPIMKNQMEHLLSKLRRDAAQ